MQRITGRAGIIALAVLIATICRPAVAESYRPPVADLEQYTPEPLPPGFGVQHTDADGPVFTNTRGLTLYIWPVKGERNGDAGEQKGGSACSSTKSRTTAGLTSPYPAGLLLPELDTRPSCVDLWPPVYADDDAKATGRFTIIKRKDGRRQWAYGGSALYTSVLDTKPGQVNGGRARATTNDEAAPRKPVGPSATRPPEFTVKTVATGRLVLNRDGYSVYVWDGDARNKSNCKGSCLKQWVHVGAGRLSLPQGEWGIIEAEPGVRQWTFRGHPLYTHILDSTFHSLEGSDVVGWHNVYTQINVGAPRGFTVQDSRLGQVLADANGHSIYTYNCGDDAPDQLACDHPNLTQVYRLAICGNGDPAVCNKTWPYVHAAADAKSNSLIWAVAWIDPKTGHFAQPTDPGAIHVWTYRDRPIYTFGGDTKPGDVEGESWGEFMGNRDGFRAFWLRDDFFGNAD